MASITMKTATGADAGAVELPDDIFGIEPNVAVMHQVVTAQLAAARSGTHSTKGRSDVSGGGAKPWRQKGTGRARQGTIRAPQFAGGGHTFAKVPRTFDQKVNRKAQRSALRSVLAAHAQAGTVAVVSADQFDAPSTKSAKALLESWGKETPLVVVALHEEENIAKSFRNLERVVVISPGELEVAALVWARSLIVSEAALPLVEGRAQ